VKPQSVVVIVLAVVAIGAALLFTRLGGGDGDEGASTTTTSTTAQAPADAQRLSFIVSPEKEELLKQVVQAFNAGDHRSDGRPVFVEMQAMNSGDAESAIVRGKLEPDVWSPASSFWGRLLNFQADRSYVPDENPSIVRTPLVIAMWEPMARALG
jgi:Ca-activated chloride channel family protein